MKLGVQENIFNGWNFVSGKTLDEKIAKIEDFGFDAIEVWGWDVSSQRLAEIKSAISSTNLKCSTICGGYPGDLLGIDRKSRECAVEGIKERLKACAELGSIGQIVIDRSMDFSISSKPRISDLWPWEPDINQIEKKILVEECKILGSVGREYGVCVILEPINHFSTDFLTTIDQAIDVCSLVGSDNVKLMADFYHMNIEEADVGKSLMKASDRIIHVHLKDSNGQLPGLGHTNFTEGINILKQQGYSNYLTMECEIKSESDLQVSAKHMRTIM